MITYRVAEPSDATALYGLERDLFGAEAWSFDTVSAELAAAWTHYLLAQSAPDGAIVGYAGISVPVYGAPCDIQTVAVTSAHRRRGIARALLCQLSEEAARRGATEMMLEVRADNPAAQRLYAQLGFIAIGRRAGYYQPAGVDAIVMRANLPLRAGAAELGSLTQRVHE